MSGISFNRKVPKFLQKLGVRPQSSSDEHQQGRAPKMPEGDDQDDVLNEEDGPVVVEVIDESVKSKKGKDNDVDDGAIVGPLPEPSQHDEKAKPSAVKKRRVVVTSGEDEGKKEDVKKKVNKKSVALSFKDDF